ncbi:nuclear transport factor 2 family protein [Streptomyces sp. NPDC047042]|uniref:YybH family protein n=1 Tax=Streptomyces sp. NPDC047042 TaxID=3154807 RepID=UPI0033E25689
MKGKRNERQEAIGEAVLELEKSFNERWSVGANRGYLDNYAEEISCFDRVLKELIVGRDTVIAHIESLYSNPHIVRNEYRNPVVNVNDSGDFAVLAYNLDTYVLDDNGKERQLRAWNATEAYRLIDGEWRILHSHWAFTQTATEAVAS